MLVLMERCQNILCITGCYVWGCVVTDQSECSCWPLSPAESTFNGHMSIKTGPWSTGGRWPGLFNHAFFYIMWRVDRWFTREWDGTKLPFRKKAGRRGSVMSNVLLKNINLTCTTYLNIVGEHVHPFMARRFSNSSSLFANEDLRCCIGFPIQISIWSSIIRCAE